MEGPEGEPECRVVHFLAQRRNDRGDHIHDYRRSAIIDGLFSNHGSDHFFRPGTLSVATTDPRLPAQISRPPPVVYHTSAPLREINVIP